MIYEINQEEKTICIKSEVPVAELIRYLEIYKDYKLVPYLKEVPFQKIETWPSTAPVPLPYITPSTLPQPYC